MNPEIKRFLSEIGSKGGQATGKTKSHRWSHKKRKRLDDYWDAFRRGEIARKSPSEKLKVYHENKKKEASRGHKLA